MAPGYWLFKSEPETYHIDDLIKKPKKRDCWEGIRNYQARNFIRDDIKKGDLGFFYHSSCKIPGIIGIVKVIKSAYPDDTAWDPDSKYFDPKSSPDNPRWLRFDVQFVQKFPQLLSLTTLRSMPRLKDMLLLRKGNRLSITPVTPSQWKTIIQVTEK